MEKEFKRKNRKLQFIILCGCVLFFYLVFVKVLITENFLSQDIVYIAISIIILSFIFIILLFAFINLNRKVIINDSSIIIKNLLKAVEIRWPEIIEFKKQEKGFGAWAGWKYCLKVNKNGVQEIEIADNNFENLQEAIDLIFKLAMAAKFVETRNEALMPFFKNFKTYEWKNT